MTDERQKIWRPLAILAAALIVWAGLLALGAYLEWGADQPRHDLRKPLVVFGCMAAFVALWGVALWWRAGRPKRK
jgi:membrane protein DedA with SNARE-associated domain